MKGRRGIAALFFLLGFAYLFLGMFQPLDPFDEGFILVGAERILHGAIPYRNFAAYYTPGQFYTIAAVFHVFGSSILVERIWNTLVRFGLCLLVFLLARATGLKRAAYFPFFTILFYLAWCGFYTYPVIPSLFWALTAILILVLNWPANKSRWIFLAGLAAGISVLYRQDVGAYMCVSGAITMLLPAPGETWIPSGGLRAAATRLRPAVSYALGACLVLLPALFYFLHAVPAPELWANFVALPRLQLQFRRIPLPPLVPRGVYLLSSLVLQRAWFLFYAPVAVYAAVCLKASRELSHLTRVSGIRKQQFATVLLAIFGLLLLVTTFTRTDPAHCLAPTIPAAILAAALFQHWHRGRAWQAIPLGVCVAVLAVPYGVSPIVRWTTNLKNSLPWSSMSSLPRARFFRVPKDQEQAVMFIQRVVPNGDAIFVGNSQQRQVFANDAIFYFLADRKPGTRYEEFEPGVVTTAPVQREMVTELQANRVHWVILFSGFESRIRENSLSVIGADVLDNFIRRKYTKVVRLGRYTILKRRVGSADAPFFGH